MKRCAWVVIVLTLFPILLVPAVQTLLPERIPTRWGAGGQIEAWSSPFGVWLSFQAMIFVVGLLYPAARWILRRRQDTAETAGWILAVVQELLLLMMLSLLGCAWYGTVHAGPVAPGLLIATIAILNGIFLWGLWLFMPLLFPGQPGNAAVTRRILLATGVFLLVTFGAIAKNVWIGGEAGDVLRISYSGIGWLFLVIGNVLPKLKSNMWAGFRLKWTLNDPDIWYRTHRLAGKLWVVGGLLLAFAPFLLPLRVLRLFFWLDLAVLSLLPVIYAWRLAREQLFTAVPPDGPDRSSRV